MEAFVPALAFVAGFALAYTILSRRYGKRKRDEWEFVKACQDHDVTVHAAAMPDGKVAMIADCSNNQELNK